MPGEEEIEEEHHFSEYPLMSQAFCPVCRQLLSFHPHGGPSEGRVEWKLKPMVTPQEDGKAEICSQVYLMSLKDAACSWGESLSTRKGLGRKPWRSSEERVRAAGGASAGE